LTAAKGPVSPFCSQQKKAKFAALNDGEFLKPSLGVACGTIISCIYCAKSRLAGVLFALEGL